MQNNQSRIQPLDGLRGISIFLVLVAHAGYGAIVPGGFGVTVFFFISGYIITKLLLGELSSVGDIDLKAFYVRRAFRILPALMCYLFVSTIYIWACTSFVDWSHLAAAIFNYYNYYYIYFLRHSGEFGVYHPYSIVWSLAVEEHYYIVFPLALFLARKRLRQFAFVLAFLCLAALVWRLGLLFSGALAEVGINRTYKATDARFDSIVFGALFAILGNSGAGRSFLDKLKAARFLWIAIALLLVSFAVRAWEFRETVRYTLQGVALFIAFPTLLQSGGLLNRVLCSRALIYLGAISYSLYLWHWLVFVVAERELSKSVPQFVFALLVIVVSIALAHLSYIFVEKPALAMRKRMI